MVLLFDVLMYLFVFSRRSQERCIEQLRPMPGVFFHGLSQTCVLSLVSFIARRHRLLSLQRTDADLAASNAFHGSCFSQGTMDEQAEMQLR